MRLALPISLVALLWSMGVSPVAAQQKPTPLSEYAWVSPVLPPAPTLPSVGFAGGTRQGAIWSGVGVTAGSLAGFFLAVFPGLHFCSSYESSEMACALSIAVPFGIGTTAGASLGAETGGDSRAWGTTLIGSAIGMATAVIVAVQADVWGLGLFILPPAAGAWLGNRLGQR